MLVVKALPQIAVLAVYKSKSNDIAPSPSGKAGDFDSPIVGSTPAGATARASEITVDLMISEALSFLLFVF